MQFYVIYSKELSLGNQPLETQCWIWPQFIGNRLAGSEILSFQENFTQFYCQKYLDFLDYFRNQVSGTLVS